MKKTLSVLAVLGIASIIGTQSASAFTWSDLNPFNWGRCNRCEKVQKQDCGCPKVQTPCPCSTGAAAPCAPCNKQIITPKQPCDACDRLQQEMKR